MLDGVARALHTSRSTPAVARAPRAPVSFRRRSTHSFWDPPSRSGLRTTRSKTPTPRRAYTGHVRARERIDRAFAPSHFPFESSRLPRRRSRRSRSRASRAERARSPPRSRAHPSPVARTHRTSFSASASRPARPGCAIAGVLTLSRSLASALLVGEAAIVTQRRRPNRRCRDHRHHHSSRALHLPIIPLTRRHLRARYFWHPSDRDRRFSR